MLSFLAEVNNTLYIYQHENQLWLYKLDLAGDNNLQTAKVQMIWDTIQESYNAASRALTETDKTKKVCKALARFHFKSSH